MGVMCAIGACAGGSVLAGTTGLRVFRWIVPTVLLLVCGSLLWQGWRNSTRLELLCEELLSEEPTL